MCVFIYLKEKQMSQAKTLTQAELDQVLRFINTKKFALRNRTMMLTSHWSGMRVGEIASLSISDVMNPDKTIKSEIRLTAEQTKGRHPRTVFLPEKLKAELANYLEFRETSRPEISLFFTAQQLGFSANSLCQWFFWTYRNAGISGASSHTGRRNFITSLANKGISVRVLASLAGHRSIAVTQKYIDINDDLKRNAVELI
jgi:integrase/recombinase XerD